jgi:hypothetical protein
VLTALLAIRQAPTVADLKTVIHEHDKRIVEEEILRRHDLRRQVSRTNKSGRKWRNGDYTSDTTLRFHGDLCGS